MVTSLSDSRNGFVQSGRDSPLAGLHVWDSICLANPHVWLCHVQPGLPGAPSPPQCMFNLLCLSLSITPLPQQSTFFLFSQPLSTSCPLPYGRPGGRSQHSPKMPERGLPGLEGAGSQRSGLVAARQGGRERLPRAQHLPFLSHSILCAILGAAYYCHLCFSRV